MWSGCYHRLAEADSAADDDAKGGGAPVYQHDSDDVFLRWQPGRHTVRLARSDTAGFWCLSNTTLADATGWPLEASGPEVVPAVSATDQPPWADGPPVGGWSVPGLKVVPGDSLLAVWAVGLRMAADQLHKDLHEVYWSLRPTRD
jgi:hypothetical protein